MSTSIRDPRELIVKVAPHDRKAADRMMKEVLMLDPHSSLTLPLALIRTDGGTQPRAEVDPFAVDEYADSLRSGAQFPPVTVFYDGENYWLADGFHRVNASCKVELTTIAADVRQGTRRDAVLFSVGANATHGLRRTNADKRRAVEVLLGDKEWEQWSDRQIAKCCSVSHEFVRKLRPSLSTVDSENRSYTTKHGTSARMRTSDIGKGKKQIVYERAPENIKQSVQNGDMGTETAFRLTAELDALPEGTRARVAEVIVAHDVQDPAIVPILGRISKSTSDEPTFDELVATGVIQNDNTVIPLSNASALDLQRHLDEKAKEHRRTAHELRLQGQFDKIKYAPDGMFSVVYADPPWRYDNATLGGSAENHYPTMPTEDICRVPRTIGLETTPNAVLLLWATNALLPEALTVMDAWGFEYKSNFAWDKDEPTYGNLAVYVEGQHELLFIGIRGSFQPNYKYPSVIREKKRGHSEKPQRLYSMIETMYPNQRYIELFARKPDKRTSWAYWGLEAEAAHAGA